MKRIALLMFVVVAVGFGQVVPHTATLTWSDTANPTGTTYNVYRFAGLCSGSPTFTLLASAIAPKTYQDASLNPGNYCYVVTAVYQAAESVYSNSALAAALPWVPEALAVTVAGQSASLAWTDAKNPAGTTWSVQRATGLCSGSPSFSSIATGLTAKEFTDNTVSVGQYCYQVTATNNGMQSAPGASQGAQIPAASPTGLNVQVQ
jgi:hypothetical protein